MGSRSASAEQIALTGFRALDPDQTADSNLLLDALHITFATMAAIVLKRRERAHTIRPCRPIAF